jgi:predicted ribosome quality control (RQC) complex YloA/Tae2 family protein
MFVNLLKFSEEEIKEMFPEINSKETKDEQVYSKTLKFVLQHLNKSHNLNKKLQDKIKFLENEITKFLTKDKLYRQFLLEIADYVHMVNDGKEICSLCNFKETKDRSIFEEKLQALLEQQQKINLTTKG